ncbi:MAG: sigma 54-interacting transcriptional regulator [Thermodesulfovibrionaceae bacterium]
MSLPVFKHTISKLREILIEDSNKVSDYIRYDPIIAYILLREVNKPASKIEITDFSQIVTYLGTKKLEEIIIERDLFLEEEDLQIWIYGVLSAEICFSFTSRFTYIHKDEAFFAGLLPCLGLIFMMNEFPKYRRIIHFLVKLPIEDRVFLEEAVFGTNNIEALKRNIIFLPFKEAVNTLSKIFTKDGRKDISHCIAPFGSTIQRSCNLALLSDLSAYGAQALMFPSVIDNKELFLELSKRYFRVKESDSLEILQSSMDRFLKIAEQFNVTEEIRFSADRFYELRRFKFETKNSTFAKMLQNLFKENASDRNIYIYGETATGKRLLAAALHLSEDNPRRDKPLIMIFSDVDVETLEEEFFGIKEGYLGRKGKKGILEIAQGATLVIKEFDRMPIEFQEKLKKALKTGIYYRMGEIEATDIKDIKFILIGKEDLRVKAAAGEFSAELINLLNPVFFKIPPLRERREDVFYIAEQIIKKYHLPIEESISSQEVLEKLRKDSFPNNLKDLKRFLFLLYIQRLLF